MNTGDRVGKYRITQPFTNAGGGQSEWTFAERDGVSYFLKRFLRPTYPVNGAPGSEQTKENKRRQCAMFENHHRGIQALLAPLSAGGGNLVVSREFFLHDAHYYKVTERIDTTTMPLTAVAALPLREQVPLMVSVAHSLGILHRKGLVHGDVKPDNLLLKKGADGFYTAKLIDFDDCFRTGAPPDPDDMVGDPAYYSPEMTAYLRGETDGATVTAASDVFALGLVFTRYLTGSAPVVGAQPEEPSAAGEPVLPPLLGGREVFAPLLAAMLHPVAGKRPALPEVADALKRADKGSDHRKSPPHARRGGLRISKNLLSGSGPGTTSTSTSGSGLVGKGLRAARPTADADAPAGADAAAPDPHDAPPSAPEKKERPSEI